MKKDIKKFIHTFLKQEEFHEKLEKKDKVSVSKDKLMETFNQELTRPINPNFVNMQLVEEKDYSNSPVLNSEVEIHLRNLSIVTNKRNYIIRNFHDSNLITAIRLYLADLCNSTPLMKDIFLGSRTLGEPSSFGIALYSKKGNFIFKISKTNNSDEMRHEFIVGNILSELRSEIPNFTAVYEYLELGNPVISSSGQVVQACNNISEKTGIAVYEYVNEAKSISDLDDPVSFLSCFMQTVLALNTAYERFNFTHYDCHDDNVLTYKYSEREFYIKYIVHESEIYVKSFGRIATIIDYGQSHIRKNGVDYGILNYEDYWSIKGVYCDMGNSMFDYFKLVMMCIKKYRYTRNYILVNLCMRIASYFFENFSSQDFDVIDSKMWDCRYGLRPELSKYMKWTSTGFIVHCLDIAKEYRLISISKPRRVFGEITSELEYPLPKPFVYEWRDFNLSIPKEFYNGSKKQAISKLEKNYDYVARNISYVLYLKEKSDENYLEYKEKADNLKKYVEDSYNTIRIYLYEGKYKLDELSYNENTKDLKRIFRKIYSVTSSFLEL